VSWTRTGTIGKSASRWQKAGDPAAQIEMRPISITLISILAVAVGAGGFVSHARQFESAHPGGTIALCALSLAAVIAGIFMFHGRNWARWLWMLWMTFHVAISFFNGLSEMLVHAVMLGIFAFLLFRPRASAYFRPVGV
jgi:hypothetical protein